MNARKIAAAAPVLAMITVGVWQLSATRASADESKSKDKDTKKKPSAILSVQDLQKRRGPTPPAGSMSLGVAAQPAVGELTLPIRDVQVYEFNAMTPEGRELPVKWAYTKKDGTYMWGTTRIMCGDGTTIARGGFVTHLHDDGSGAYALGSNQCPIGAAYGCRFDTKGKETTCGLCTWTANELTCAEDSTK